MWETFILQYHSFNRIFEVTFNWYFCISIHAFCRVSYAIFCYTVVHAVWYAVWLDLVIAHWITMNMPYPVWKCLPYGSTHPPYYIILYSTVIYMSIAFSGLLLVCTRNRLLKRTNSYKILQRSCYKNIVKLINLTITVN